MNSFEPIEGVQPTIKAWRLDKTNQKWISKDIIFSQKDGYTFEFTAMPRDWVTLECHDQAYFSNDMIVLQEGKLVSQDYFNNNYLPDVMKRSISRETYEKTKFQKRPKLGLSYELKEHSEDAGAKIKVYLKPRGSITFLIVDEKGNVQSDIQVKSNGLWNGFWKSAKKTFYLTTDKPVKFNMTFQKNGYREYTIKAEVDGGACTIVKVFLDFMKGRHALLNCDKAPIAGKLVKFEKNPASSSLGKQRQEADQSQPPMPAFVQRGMAASDQSPTESSKSTSPNAPSIMPVPNRVDTTCQFPENKTAIAEDAEALRLLGIVPDRETNQPPLPKSTLSRPDSIVIKVVVDGINLPMNDVNVRLIFSGNRSQFRKTNNLGKAVFPIPRPLQDDPRLKLSLSVISNGQELEIVNPKRMPVSLNILSQSNSGNYELKVIVALRTK